MLQYETASNMPSSKSHAQITLPAGVSQIIPLYCIDRQLLFHLKEKGLALYLLLKFKVSTSPAYLATTVSTPLSHITSAK